MASNLKKSDIGTLLSHFQTVSGFQRSNRFRVDITPPSPLQEVSLFAVNIQVPSQTITYYSDTMAPSGNYIDIPARREYDDRFMIEFIVDKLWIGRKFFDDWVDLMFVKSQGSSYKNSVMVNYWNKIKGKIDIHALDLTDKTNRRITLFDAWPSTILPNQLSNDTPGEYLTLVIDMNYRYYTTSAT